MTRRIRIGGADLNGGDSQFEQRPAAAFIVRDDADPAYHHALAETIAQGRNGFVGLGYFCRAYA